LRIFVSNQTDLFASAMPDIAKPQGSGRIEVALPRLIDDVAAIPRGQHEVVVGDRVHVGEAMPEGIAREFRHEHRVEQPLSRRVS
jgi:hypothetical protein